MQFTKNKKNEVELKTKNAVAIFDHGIFVNEIELEGAGEYEIGGISIEGISDNIYIFKVEDIVLGIVNFKEKITKTDIEKLSNSEVLIVRIDGDVTGAVEQATQIEPKITIYLGSPESKEKLASSGVEVRDLENLKITRSELEEERAYFFDLANE